MKVVNTKFAILDVDFFLLSAARVADLALTLVGGVLSHDDIVGHFGRE